MAFNPFKLSILHQSNQKFQKIINIINADGRIVYASIGFVKDEFVKKETIKKVAPG
ncbi:hypothetical protein M2408_005294 [Sphingobacterium sp. BIGb0165]|nr:hypothetical protein [Sphingobacterium sp. BIGb0165]